MATRRSTAASVVLLVVGVLLVLGYVALGGSGDQGSGDQGSGDQGSGVVARSSLPPEARRTLRLVEQGGPFPYERDGVTFGNVEGHLPREPRGFYREYTVPTPGSSDRGARRLVVGRDRTTYYTSDHYASFRRVVDR